MSLEIPRESPPENAYATLAMIREIDGRIMPARIAENVPTTKSSLSKPFMYLKNVKKPMLSGM